MISESTEYNLPISISQTEKYIRTKHTIKNPSFFVIDKISNDYITNHNKRHYLFLIKYDYKIFFNKDFSLHIETDFYHKTMKINLRSYLLYRIEDFIEKGYVFSHIDEVNNLTVDCKMYMTYDNYIIHPMHAMELKINMVVAKGPHLINSLNRSLIYPLIRKYRLINKDN